MLAQPHVHMHTLLLMRLLLHKLSLLKHSPASTTARQACRQVLRREVAALQAQNATLRAADAPCSGTAAESADSSAATLATHDEVARLQQELAAVEKRSTTLLAADTEHRSSASHVHALTGLPSRQYGGVMQCYASGTLFTSPSLAHVCNKLHKHTDQCGRCQATILLAEHWAHHNCIHLCLRRLLLCVTQAAQSLAEHAQHSRTQCAHGTQHAHAGTLHSQARSMGGCTDEPSVPPVTTDAVSCTVLQLHGQPGLVCCMVGCNTNLHRLWYYHTDHRVAMAGCSPEGAPRRTKKKIGFVV